MSPTVRRVLYVLGAASLALGLIVLAGLAASGEPLFSFDAGGAWGGVGCGLATLASVRASSRENGDA